ncbi:hypothetical protein LTR37_014107 [Vermiconidia calcicola]|uniref:Uncharacterized protein n=1 Tax=Vermiconidia calcicola TaxID=1690605 RepID=A0ACC3MUU7_9PEZI|nr:hypothetical protein LTR37_014107 [Vermiconidia calcicola]
MTATQQTTISGKPPFLFRVASDDSRGFNSTDEIDPLHGYESQYHADLDSMDYPTARHMVRDHINWKYYAPSEFSSWSVSLLYVLVHAVRKAYSEGETNVLIYVMDTSLLPASNSLHSAVELVKDYKVDFDRMLIPYAKGEYFVHGKIHHTQGLWQTVKFDDLLAAGFFEAFPTMKDKSRQSQLFQRVLGLRMGYFHGPTFDITAYLSTIKKLARCFGHAWEGIMTIALISLRKRDLKPDSVTRLLSDLQAHGTRLPQLPWASDPALRMFHLVVRDIPEAMQLMQLLRLLHDRQTAQPLIIQQAAVLPAATPLATNQPATP